MNDCGVGIQPLMYMQNTAAVLVWGVKQVNSWILVLNWYYFAIM